MAHDAMPSSAGRLAPPVAARITQRTVMLSVATASLLILIKAWAWMASGSVSILASLADSGLDLAASLFTLGAVSYAAAPPDQKHRFGHGKAEGFAALMQAVLVGASATFIAIEAIDRFRNPRPVMEGGLGIAVMIISILLTLGLIYFQTRALRQTGSVATAGDRAHYAADLAANMAVIVGVIASSYLGLPIADPVIGLAIALWLAWGAFGVAREAADQLMDKELSEADRERIKRLARGDERMIDVHQLRTRASGPIIHIQFHLDMPRELSLVEAHQLMVACENRILEEFPGADILIHPDPRGSQPHGGDFFAENYKAEPEASAVG
ncbi:MAG: cation-efflux pump [Hirschia sp.]|nr:cation-efflux pump [Hirschia sp.]MBB35533.1 cation-efflux pump [Hirschia sp.]MBF17517.1 cation-efflux pump [Hirschia sp.]